MKKIFITGATGFVGTHALEYFSDKGNYEIFGTNYKSDNKVVDWIDDEHLITLNLLDQEAIKGVVGRVKPDYVIHLAAMSSPKMSFEKPQETMTNNIAAQINLFEALRLLDKQPEKVLIIGSAEEYGLVSADDCPINETTPLKPTSPYAVSKIAQDYLGLQYYLSYGLPAVRLRPFNHTGERRPETFVLPAFAKQVAEIEAGIQESIIHVGNLEPVRDFTDVKDMVRAYEMALIKGTPGDVYNIGSGEGISIKKLLDILLELTEKKITVEIDDTRVKPADVPVLVADNSKFVNQTGWKPKIPIQETVKRVLNYWRSQVKKQK